MNKPQVRFKGFDDEWKAKSLSSPEFSILAGGDVNKNELKIRGKYPVIANALSNEGILGFYDNYYRIKSPAVSITGRGEVGVAVPRRQNFTPVVRLLALTSPNDIDFLSCAINKHPKILESTGVPQLTVPKLQSYNIHFPSYTEQSQIGTYFRQLDEMIAEVEREICRLEKMKQASLQKMFPRPGATTPEIRFAGFSESWKEKLAKEVCDISTGKSNTQDQVEGGLYPFFIRSDKPVRSNRYLYDCEAVITIGDGQIGKVFHYINGKFDLHQRCYFMSNFRGIEAKYFYYFFSAYFYDRAMTMTAKATVDSVRLDMIADMPIYFPESIEEQKAISDYFRNLDSLISTKRQKLTKLRNIKQACLDKMFVNTSEL